MAALKPALVADVVHFGLSRTPGCRLSLNPACRRSASAVGRDASTAVGSGAWSRITARGPREDHSLTGAKRQGCQLTLLDAGSFIADRCNVSTRLDLTRRISDHRPRGFRRVHLLCSRLFESHVFLSRPLLPATASSTCTGTPQRLPVASSTRTHSLL